MRSDASCMAVEYKMKLPSVEEFNNLHPDCGLPELPMGRIEEYHPLLRKILRKSLFP